MNAWVPSACGHAANVTGMTAGSKDFNDTMKSHLPLVFGFVLGLTFLLLPDQAIAHAIKQTAGVVTSAAIVMVAVFSITTLSSLEFKQMGVGLAVAILIDATIVRAVLLPATMKLLGEWNWYLPSGLRWLPSPAHEPSPKPSNA